jgi:hypothetical protein
MTDSRNDAALLQQAHAVACPCAFAQGMHMLLLIPLINKSKHFDHSSNSSCTGHVRA